jgi:chromosome segregation ATPase
MWISGLQNTVLAVMLQNPTTSTEDELSGLQEKLIRSSSVNSTSSDDDGLSASGARTSVGLVLDGTKIASIVKGSPAAGDVRIEANDCIMTVDGQKVDKNSVLNLLRGTDELGSLVRLKLRKHGTLKTTYEAVLRRTEMRRIRDVAALYQLTEEMTKNPGKVLAQKVAEKVAAVEQHDRAMYIAALEHVDGLQVLLRRFSEERGNKYYQAGGVILDLQEWKDGVLSGDSFSTDATPRFFTPRSEPSPPPDQGWAEMERHEAEIAEANKSIKSLQRTIASLEQQVQEAEAKAAEMNRALQVALVDKETLARELIQAQDEASETQCRVQQERSLHESAHSTIRTSTTEEMHLLKEKNETIAQLEDEVSSLNRELDRMKDILQEAQDCAARDLAEMVGQQSELYQEQVEGMVSERENLKERIRVLDVENQNLQNAIAGLDRQIKELEDGQEQIISDAEERARVNFDSERAKLEEAMKNAQKKCTEQIHQMEQLVASVRMETAGELAEEKRLYAEAQKQLREAEYKCGVVAEKHENIMRVKQALEQDIIRLSSKADTASKKTSDTERLLFADAANHRRDVENLENENSRLRAEKRALEAQTDSIPSLQEEIERCRTEIARLDDDNTSLRSAMRQLDATVDVAQESLAEAERKRSEADAALGTSKDKITLLESENERLGSVERLLGLDLKEANLRLADAQAILKETMDMVEAPSPSALARIVASLVKEAGKVAEHEHFRQRAQDSESILNALSELLHAPDYQALPRLVTSLASQRLALSNAQIQLEEEVKALRSQLEGVKRQSQSEMVTKEDELRRISMALSQAESDRDRYEADLMFANKQLAAVAGSIPALEQELENQGHAHTMMHNKLGSITEERDGLIAQLQHTEHELSQLVLDKQRFAERNQLLEEQKIRLEKESLDNMEKLKRTAASNVQLRQQMEKYTVALEQHESSSNLVLDNLRQEYMKTRDDMERLREQRDVALQALDNLQNEAKQSNLRANSLSSNLDAVLYDLEDLRAQRNAAIHQVRLLWFLSLHF